MTVMADKKAIFVNGGNGVATQDEVEHGKDLARRYRCEFVDLKNFHIQHELFRKIKVDLMFRYNFVPLEETQDGRLVIAMADPSQLMMMRRDQRSAGPAHHHQGRDAVADQRRPEEDRAVAARAGRSRRELRARRHPRRRERRRDHLDREADRARATSARSSAWSTPPSSPRCSGAPAIFTSRRATTRSSSSTASTACCSRRCSRSRKEHHSTIISRIKVMSELDISERRVPQDGRFRVRYNARSIDFRVSIMPSIHGEDAVLRVLDKESMSEKFHKLTLDVVGFGEEDLRKFRRYIKEPYGMVLVTGPTGSGKTTTLYAALNEIKTDEDKLITIEDPVEYQIRGITQIPVNEKKGLTFARGLRSILRHDPDKIMVGEIRDTETAQIAINSALTGHLVFTTVHANNVVDVLGRFLNMGVEAYNFVSALNCILAQRLVRLICEFCKKEVHYSDEELEASGMDPKEWANVPFYEGEGCIECSGTGFSGRTAIHELLELTDNVREMILAKKPSSEIRRAAREEGMHFLRESAIDRVKRGLTTLKEINKVTFIETTR